MWRAERKDLLLFSPFVGNPAISVKIGVGEWLCVRRNNKSLATIDTANPDSSAHLEIRTICM